MTTTQQTTTSKRVHVTVPPDLYPVFEHLAKEDAIPVPTKIMQMAKSWLEYEEDKVFEEVMQERLQSIDKKTSLSHNELLDELGIEV